MKKIDLLRFLDNEGIDFLDVAAERIKKNQIRDAASLVKQKYIRATIAEFINFIGDRLGLSYGLKHESLKLKNRPKGYEDANKRTEDLGTQTKMG